MQSLHADFSQAPPNFSHQSKTMVWVDFLAANYEIVFHADRAKSEVITTIEFEQTTAGHPLFDSVNELESAKINGVAVNQYLIQDPDGVTEVRYIDKFLAPGIYTLTLTSSLEHGVSFNTNRKRWESVTAGFFIRDLTDRKLLERYLPTNFEYDNYSMAIDVKVTGTKRWHSLFANGDIEKITENHYRVKFPEYYVSSSVFFHLAPINKYVRWYLTYPSIDGRDLPVTIYSNFRFFNKKLKKKAWRVLKELEADYGPWPHNQLIIYGTGLRGGMEYAGATETSLVSLGHELQHAYFAKGIHPANGNSGWLDEAIASWRDKGHQTLERPFYDSANLGAQSVYTRKTDRRSYEYGRSFMAYLDYKIKNASPHGLKDFLRYFVEKRMHSSVTTHTFQNDLEEFMGTDLDQDFNQYIFGPDLESKSKSKLLNENPHHPRMTQEDLRQLLK